MDQDLFQIVLLGLQVIGIILLVALLATLGALRKALEQRSTQAATASASEADQRVATRDETPSATESRPAVGTAGSAAGTGPAATIRGVLEQHGLETAQAQPQAATTPSAQQPAAQEHAADSVFAAHADDPQEEPFQRDGRWWFRRGNELLLYDEATGQWQPAPEAAGSSGGSAAATQTQQLTETGAQANPLVADQVATYWKCPTCGAVNGSTAATCRMCFAARP